MERPILFSGPMVRALLDGRKTQTRRVVKLQPGPLDHPYRAPDGFWYVTDSQGGHLSAIGTREGRCPYGVPGDRLWVRETWKPHSLYAHLPPRDMPQAKIFYRADDGYAPSNTKWFPGIHMPRWASRLTLQITDVRVERLNDCSEADAQAEGLQWITPGKWAVDHSLPIIGDDPTLVYRGLWEHINGPGSWDANPWVWAVSFEVVK